MSKTYWALVYVTEEGEVHWDSISGGVDTYSSTYEQDFPHAEWRARCGPDKPYNAWYTDDPPGWYIYVEVEDEEV